MSLIVTETGGSDFQSAPAGTHVARCIRLIDIGTHHDSYQGKATVRKRLIVMWELPDEPMQDGRPFVCSKFYTASLSEKANLRKDLESWRGRAFTEDELAGFDLKQILGKPCLLSIVEKDGGGTKVGGVMKLPKGTEVPLATNEVWAFDIDEWDDERFASMSDGLKRLITESDEYIPPAAAAPAGKQRQPSAMEDLTDDIPF